MYCPYCAAEDRDKSQFCRSCGAGLHVVRTAIQRPDSITTAAASAREEIGRAIAARIKDIRKDSDLRHVVEDVLPKVEKFLESPEERRMRRFREGVISAAAGLAVAIFCLFVSGYTNSHKDEFLAFGGAGAGLVAFLVGVGLIINARWFTIPSGRSDLSRRLYDNSVRGELSTGSLDSEPPSSPSSSPASVTSVTEGTTRHLK